MQTNLDFRLGQWFFSFTNTTNFLEIILKNYLYLLLFKLLLSKQKIKNLNPVTSKPNFSILKAAADYQTQKTYNRAEGLGKYDNR